MKKIVISLAFAFIGISALAQIQRRIVISGDTSNTMQTSLRKNDRFKWMNELNLTKQQKQQIKEMHRENRSKMAEVMNDKTLSVSQKQDKLIDLKKISAYNFREILSEEQKAALGTIPKKERKKTGTNLNNDPE
ncbi:MAG: hypothetical protein ABIS01_06365 [Ferruginibacter sp.]